MEKTELVFMGSLIASVRNMMAQNNKYNYRYYLSMIAL